MANIDPDRRLANRRNFDRSLKSKVDKYEQLFQVGQIITSEINFDVLFEVIIEQTNKIMDTTNCSIFLIDDQNQFLQAFISTDLKKNDIRIPKDNGVAGWVFNNRSAVIIHDPYDDPRFYPEVDKKTGFKTKCILCVPLINREDTCIGTLQVLNKKQGSFTDDDLEILTYLSDYVTIALENSRIYEELKASDRAKQKVIDHLSHELKTPLVIISTAFRRLSKHLKDADGQKYQKAIERGMRSIARLSAIQEKVDDIINRKSAEEQHLYRHMLENIADFAGETGDEGNAAHQEILDLISERINSVLQIPEIRSTEIVLDDFLNELIENIHSSIDRENFTIKTRFQKNLVIHMDRKVLQKVCTGLLKNAIENTPDEGLIEIIAESAGEDIRVEFCDHGVGITKENQKYIFGGFFHTQDTNLYSSRKPFEFNAGGSGSDLLRIQVFSERFRFKVNFESDRCRFIPGDADICSGRIELCDHVQNVSECLSSGGSSFRLLFPKSK